MKIKHVVSVSGGKDSTATLLVALQRVSRENLCAIFCDTGNEHEAVYEYLDYLELALDIKIDRLKSDFSDEIRRKRMFIARDQRVKRDKKGRKLRWTNKAKRRALEVLNPTGNPYLDLCLWKGRFPGRKTQFCTEELKRNPAVEYQLNLLDQGYQVVSWQGVRRDESFARRNAKKSERITLKLRTFRPLVDWTAEQVFSFCAQHKIEPNPLYKQGMGRVGCMPCINASKAEFSQIAKRFPQHIARISEWENLVASASKRQAATFVPAPGIATKDAGQHGIYSVVEWAKTTRGGRQYDLLGDLTELATCASSYGLCE
ncbi:phosphoadenosine phosphosulfate reductase domain-containing protein [Deefgea rivuli]|uniref:phosphoadenosine phosphosulfate reductase domain-containing protein n=1 Tax=Deefgea rivuli TaxID=400948 RepID=UPI000484F1A3|nr:phosphoadenosine phosphosulfate reductase family protein [Deefgea rivuli]